MALVWAAIVGAFLKYYLAEGVGRWHLATDSTIIDGWNSLGKWATGYFAIYIMVWGLYSEQAVASSVALALNALVPAIPFKTWAIGSSIVGLLLVGLGPYEFFERPWLSSLPSCSLPSSEPLWQWARPRGLRQGPCPDDSGGIAP